MMPASSCLDTRRRPQAFPCLKRLPWFIWQLLRKSQLAELISMTARKPRGFLSIEESNEEPRLFNPPLNCLIRIRIADTYRVSNFACENTTQVSCSQNKFFLKEKKDFSVTDFSVNFIPKRLNCYFLRSIFRVTLLQVK